MRRNGLALAGAFVLGVAFGRYSMSEGVSNACDVENCEADIRSMKARETLQDSVAAWSRAFSTCAENRKTAGMALNPDGTSMTSPMSAESDAPVTIRRRWNTRDGQFMVRASGSSAEPCFDVSMTPKYPNTETSPQQQQGFDSCAATADKEILGTVAKRRCTAAAPKK